MSNLIAFLMFRIARDRVGLPFAALAAVWFVLLPTVQRTTGSVLLDVSCALLMLGAAIFFGRYLDSQRWRDVTLFALLASVAMLTKNNALALAMLPPIAIASSRKWFIFKRWSLWSAPLIVCVICIPWYLYTWDLFTFVAAMARQRMDGALE